MKKQLAVVVVLAVIASVYATVFGYTAIEKAEYNGVIIVLDGKELQIKTPLITVWDKGTHTYVPVRAFFEALARRLHGITRAEK